jgi:hypothetical protein
MPSRTWDWANDAVHALVFQQRSHCVALGKLPVCPEKLQIVMAVTEALSQVLATANAFMEERKSEGHNTDKLPGDGHEKDSRNFGPSLPIDHWDGTDGGLCL